MVQWLFFLQTFNFLKHDKPRRLVNFGCRLQAQEEVSDSLSPLSPAIAVIRSVPRKNRGSLEAPWTSINDYK